MGSELAEKETNETSLKEYFDTLFEYALVIGMSYDQFWNDDIELLNRYHNAEMLRQKKRNNEMWLQGAYIYNAIGSLAPILNGMVKNPKAQPYMKQPIPITEEERIEQQNQRALKFVSKLDELAKVGAKPK